MKDHIEALKEKEEKEKENKDMVMVLQEHVQLDPEQFVAEKS